MSEQGIVKRLLDLAALPPVVKTRDIDDAMREAAAVIAFLSQQLTDARRSALDEAAALAEGPAVAWGEYIGGTPERDRIAGGIRALADPVPSRVLSEEATDKLSAAERGENARAQVMIAGSTEHDTPVAWMLIEHEPGLRTWPTFTDRAALAGHWRETAHTASVIPLYSAAQFERMRARAAGRSINASQRHDGSGQ